MSIHPFPQTVFAESQALQIDEAIAKLINLKIADIAKMALLDDDSMPVTACDILMNLSYRLYRLSHDIEMHIYTENQRQVRAWAAERGLQIEMPREVLENA